MKNITVVGLGAGDLDQMSVGVYRRLQQASVVYVRTLDHPVFEALHNTCTFRSFDAMYEKEVEQFEDVYGDIVDALLTLQENDIIYAVPGHPLVAEQTVQLLIEKEKEGIITLDIIGGQSFLDALFTSLRLDPVEGFQLVDLFTMKKEELAVTQHVFVTQIFDAFTASEAKLTLMERYPAEHRVAVVVGAGTTEETIDWMPLYELDRKTSFSNLMTLYIPPIKDWQQRLGDWDVLQQIVAILRSEDGCPWDRKQTHLSLRPYLIEEAHEAVQAITEDRIDAMENELGDVLLQVFLHSQIGEESYTFDLRSVVRAISEKMIRRHPHVFESKEQLTDEQLRTQWQSIKEEEQEEASETSVLDDEYLTMSSLLTAYGYQKAAAKVGFDWPTIRGAMQKFDEEWMEFREEVVHGTKATQLDEFGDVLFTLVNIARYLNISPELAMVHANEKFYRRFTHVERRALEGRGEMTAYTLEELDQFWDEAKRLEKKEG